MAEDVTSVRISFKAELADLRKAIKENTEFTDAEVRKMVARVEGRYKKMETAARRAAKKTEDGFREAYEGTGKIFKAFEGQVGGAFSVIEDFADGLGQVQSKLGPVGTIALASSLGLAAMSFAAVGLYGHLRDVADGALEARERLKESRDFYEIPPEAQASLDRYAAATAILNRQLDEASATVGGQLADNLAVLNLHLGELADNLAESSDGAGGLADGFVRVASLGIADLFLNARDAQVESTKAQLDQIAAWEQTQKTGKPVLDLYAKMAAYNTDWGEGTEKQRDAEKKRNEELQKSREAARAAAEAARAAAEAAREYQAALREGAAEINETYRLRRERIEQIAESNAALEEVARQANQDVLSGEERLQQAYEDRLALIDELEAKFGDHAKADAARTAAADRLRRDLNRLEIERLEEVDKARTEMHDRELARQAAERAAFWSAWTERLEIVSKFYEESFDIASTFIDARLDKAAAAVDREKDQLDDLRSKREDIIQRMRSAETTEQRERLRLSLEAVNADIANQRALTKERRQAARKAFRIQRATELANAGVQGAILALTASAPPPAGLGPIGGPIFATAATTAAIAKIATADPPKFHSGGLSHDEQAAILLRNEATLNARATEALGPEAINALNALGSMAMGGGQPIVVNVYVDGKLAKTETRAPDGRPRGRRDIHGGG